MDVSSSVGFRQVAGLVAIGVVLAACSSSNQSNSSGGTIVDGGTAQVAEWQPPDYVFPILPGPNNTTQNTQMLSDTLWVPMFAAPRGISPVIDYSRSLAKGTVWSSDGTVVTIDLVPTYKWPNGSPVTARDAVFDFNLLSAAVAENPANFGNFFGTGSFPQNVVSFSQTGQYQIKITFSHPVNATWMIDNNLTNIYPMPQYAWDKKSTDGPVGELDLTPAGAAAVYDFLANQSTQQNSYATNPLWSVVDGPWKLAAFNSNGNMSLVPNPTYSGPNKPHLARVDLIAFTAEAAEFNQLISGSLAVGAVPAQDVPQIPALQRAGYRIYSAPGWGVNMWVLNFQDRPNAPLTRQLYIRQALAKLVDQKSYISALFKGYGDEQYSYVPVAPANPFITPYATTNHFPFSVDGAIKLLTDHGWNVVPNGVDTCKNPGTGPTQCGEGINAGQQLALTDVYNTGPTWLVEENADFISKASSAGIKITGIQKSNDTILSVYSNVGAQLWDIEDWGGISFPPQIDPTGDYAFGKGSSGNEGGYYDAKAQTLIDATVNGNGSYADFLDYITSQVPILTQPNPKSIYAFKSNLSGIPGGLEGMTQLNFTPENWYYVK